MNETRVEAPVRTEDRKGSPGEVFVTFLKLGVTSFGGPIAHLGCFRDEFVVRRRWIDEKGYADLVASVSSCPVRHRARSTSRSGSCAKGR